MCTVSCFFGCCRVRQTGNETVVQYSRYNPRLNWDEFRKLMGEKITLQQVFTKKIKNGKLFWQH